MLFRLYRFLVSVMDICCLVWRHGLLVVFEVCCVPRRLWRVRNARTVSLLRRERGKIDLGGASPVVFLLLSIFFVRRMGLEEYAKKNTPREVFHAIIKVYVTSIWPGADVIIYDIPDQRRTISSK